MITLQNASTVEIPREFVDETIKEKKNAFMILTPSDKIIRIIPTKNQSGTKISISVEKFSADFIVELNQLLSKYKIKPLHNKGICYTHDSCKYEGFFDFSELSTSKSELIKELSEIKGVSDVKITEIAI